MKLSTFVSALYLAGLGLSIPTPHVRVETAIEPVDGASVLTLPSLNLGHFIKRAPKSTKTTRPKATKTKHRKTKTTKKTKATKTKHKKPKTKKKTKATKTKPKKPKHTKAGNACTLKSKATGKNGKIGRQADDNANPACQKPTEARFIQYSKGWRSPTKEEQRAAKIQVVNPAGDEPDVSYAGVPKVQSEPSEVTCPKDYKDLLQYLDQPKRNAALFFARVHGKEEEWAGKRRMGFRFLKNYFKKDAVSQAWLGRAVKDCPRFWEMASTAFATKVSGDVHVLLEKTFEVGQKPKWPRGADGKLAIWGSNEWPTLISEGHQHGAKNSKGCRIWRWNWDSAQHELLAVKTGAMAKASGCTHHYPDKPKAAAAGKTAGKGGKKKTTTTPKNSAS